uniref:CSON004082 protein n=1 Tax=Culicoides sonorensis TaxID=179676 RepID=A0A336MQ28_CULSO
MKFNVEIITTKARYLQEFDVSKPVISDMSWLQDLAGKAENMLNKLDQNAATVLNQTSEVVSAKIGNNIQSQEQSPLINVKIENETPSKIVRPSSRGSLMQLTPKKSASYGGNLSSLAINASSNVTTNGNGSKDDVKHVDSDKHSNNSSRRSSLTHEGTVIENCDVSKSMQTSFEAQNDSSIQQRLVELEEICNSLVVEKEFLVERNQMLEEENAKNIQSMSQFESTIARHVNNEIDLNEKLEWARKETNQAITELQQYRTRAQQTLQMKERLIEELKQGHTGHSNTEISSNDVDQIVSTLKLELNNVKSENRNLLEEISILHDKCEQGKSYTLRLEKLLEAGNEREQKLNVVQDNLVQLKSKCSQLEEDLKAKIQETILLKEQMMKQRGNFLQKLSERDSEILQLRAKASQRVQKTSNETEERIHSLTHNLVQKQAALESIIAERNALRIQLEKIDSLQQPTTVIETRTSRPMRIDVNETDDVKARIPNFMQENPFDTRFSRRVKRVYSSLDSVGIRIGVFLRMYPLARIMVIFYIVLLHLWVMLVLLSSTPSAT